MRRAIPKLIFLVGIAALVALLWVYRPHDGDARVISDIPDGIAFHRRSEFHEPAFSFSVFGHTIEYPKRTENPGQPRAQWSGYLSSTTYMHSPVFRTEDGLENRLEFTNGGGKLFLPKVYGRHPVLVDFSAGWSEMPEGQRLRLKLELPPNGKPCPKRSVRKVKAGRWELVFTPGRQIAPEFSVPYELTIPDAGPGTTFLVAMNCFNDRRFVLVEGGGTAMIPTQPYVSQWAIRLYRVRPVKTSLSVVSGVAEGVLNVLDSHGTSIGVVFADSDESRMHLADRDIAAIQTPQGWFPYAYSPSAEVPYNGRNQLKTLKEGDKHEAVVYRIIEDKTGTVRLAEPAP